MHVRNVSQHPQTVTDTRGRVCTVAPQTAVEVPDALGFALLARSPPAWRYEPQWPTPAEGTPIPLVGRT
jgi:hypothetical protein